MNKYPWLTFEVDLAHLPYKIWIQLGECLSKCEHISRIPLRPDIAQEMHKVYLAKGVSASTAIEGNTLSEEQVRQIIDKKLKLPPSREYLKQEVENILQLCNEIKDNMSKGNKLVLNIDEIKRYNKVILQNVPCPSHAVPGGLRNVPVGAGSYKAIDYTDVEEYIIKLCAWLNSDYFKIPNTNSLIGSIIKSIIAHLYIEWIHPFGDGNGRLGRIVEFAILINSGVPSPAAQLLSNHYNATRNEYYAQLEKASKTYEVCDFISYAVQGFRDGLIEQLEYIFKQVLDTSWESFIYDIFKEHRMSEKVVKRIRTLVFELSRQLKPIPKENLITLSSKLIGLYRSGSQMMITRDLNELLVLDLIEKTERGYRAKTERMLSFLPPRMLHKEIP